VGWFAGGIKLQVPPPPPPPPRPQEECGVDGSYMI
jgi:hypothetical protein